MENSDIQKSKSSFGSALIFSISFFLGYVLILYLVLKIFFKI
jgi:hypothetical protein